MQYLFTDTEDRLAATLRPHRRFKESSRRLCRPQLPQRRACGKPRQHVGSEFRLITFAFELCSQRYRVVLVIQAALSR